MKRWKGAVIGAGPAGIAAAIQLKRCGIEPLLLERNEAGGLLRNAALVENYPGFPGGIGGRELAELFTIQLAAAGVEITAGEVRNLEYDGNTFLIETPEETYAAESVVIASGTKPKRAEGIMIEGKIRGRVLTEVVPLYGAHESKIVIIGAGDAAFDYACSLSRTNEVTILGRSERPRCIPVLRERCGANPSVSWMPGVAVSALRACGAVVELDYSTLNDGSNLTMQADYVILAVGREPSLDFLAGDVKERLDEFARARKLLLAGDVGNGRMRQTAISVGDGVRAAMEIAASMNGELE